MSGGSSVCVDVVALRMQTQRAAAREGDPGNLLAPPVFFFPHRTHTHILHTCKAKRKEDGPTTTASGTFRCPSFCLHLRRAWGWALCLLPPPFLVPLLTHTHTYKDTLPSFLSTPFGLCFRLYLLIRSSSTCWLPFPFLKYPHVFVRLHADAGGRGPNSA